MLVSRREFLTVTAAGAGAASLVALGEPATAQTPATPRRVLKIASYANAPGIEVPASTALYEGLEAMAAYDTPTITRYENPQLITSVLLSGTAEFAEDGPESVVASVDRGADLKIIGYFYRTVDLVFVANGDRIKTYKDLESPDNAVAVSEKTDSSWVMFTGPLLKSGVDLNKVNVIELGGSASRMRALLSGRVQAVAMHFDQAADITRDGPYKVIFEPWKFYKMFPAEVWTAQSSWLKKPENARVAVDVIKATTRAFRRANRDFDWYLQMYHKYAITPNAKDATAQSLRPFWNKLSTEVKAWPDYGILTPADFAELLPIYKAAGVFTGNINAADVVDASYAQQALKELGKEGL